MGTGTGTPLEATTTTLTTLRDRLEILLSDATNARWDTDTLNEAIRLALAHYTLEIPHVALATITLTADGREIDVSTLTYINVIRLWWDYDSSDPTHPPKWRNFEQWPDDIIYINDPNEPVTGDVVRFWYTTVNTLSGLDSESATTFTAAHDAHIITGAAGYAALARSVDRTEVLNIDGWTHQRLKLWGNELLQQFALTLQTLASRNATRAAGIVKSPPLDRWDTGGW